MKKTLLTLALCAASFMGTAFAEGNPFEIYQSGYSAVVTGSGTYSQLIDALKIFSPAYDTEGYPFIQFGEIGGATATVTFSEDDATEQKVGSPLAITLMFANATLEFKDLLTVVPDPLSDFGPGMMVGTWDGGPGQLKIAVAESAIKGWLEQQESLEDVASWALVDNAAEIQPTEGADVKFQLIDAEGNVTVDQGGELDFNGHKYINKGIVWNEGDLEANQFALLYKPGPLTEDQKWGGAQFRVLALGENYVPVPEPTTGTLSLLALAGLAARRRK